MVPIFEAYRVQRADLTSDWRVARWRPEQATRRSAIVKNLTRDEAWRAARSMAEKHKGQAILVGIGGQTKKSRSYFSPEAAVASVDAFTGRVSDPAIATLHLVNASAWAQGRREQVIAWLRRQAATLGKEGGNYAKQFRATFRARLAP